MPRSGHDLNLVAVSTHHLTAATGNNSKVMAAYRFRVCRLSEGCTTDENHFVYPLFQACLPQKYVHPAVKSASALTICLPLHMYLRFFITADGAEHAWQTGLLAGTNFQSMP